MEVLLCAGNATSKIANAIRPRFISGGVNLLTENTISSIQDIIDRGEYFDRAVIMENGLIDTEDEAVLRNSIASFIRVCLDNGYKDTTFVFVSSTEETATIIFEETLSISNQRVVLLNKSQLTVNFSIDCCVKNLKEFEDRLIFSIDDIEDTSADEEIVYSQEHNSEESYNVDSSSELEIISEVNIEDIEVVNNEEDTQEIENTNDGFEINDFDSLYDEDENSQFNSVSFESISDDFITNTNEEEEIEEDTEEFQYNTTENEYVENNEVNDTQENVEYTEEDNDEEEELQTVGEYNYTTDEIGVLIEDDVEEFEGSLDYPIGNTENTYDFESMDEIVQDKSPEGDILPSYVCSVNLEKRPIVNLDKEPIDELQILDSDLEIHENELGIEDIKIEDDIPEQDKVSELFGTDEINIEENIEQIEPESESIEINESLFGISETSEVPEEFQYKSEETKEQTNITEEIKDDTQKKKRRFGNRRNNKSGSDTGLETMLKSFKNRGNSLVVTGTRCSGVSTMVNSIANLLVNMGCTVLIVDLDIKNRAQSFISKEAYDAVHSLDTENASVKFALNAVNNNVSRYTNVVKVGLHVLTMGLAGDVIDYNDLAPKNKLARFSSNVRNSYNFIIYDIPFDVATSYAEDIIFTADNIVIACEKSTHGIMNTMLSMCNIDNDEMLEAMFCRTQICLTKSKEFNKFMGVNVRNNYDILRRLDVEVQSLLGIEPEYRFSDIDICGDLKYRDTYEDLWFSNKTIIDTDEGKDEYLQLLNNILVKK